MSRSISVRIRTSLKVGWIDLSTLDELAAIPRAKILHCYRKLDAQLADAALPYLAEREGLDTILTLDRRDSSVYRLSGNRRLHLLPE